MRSVVVAEIEALLPELAARAADVAQTLPPFRNEINRHYEQKFPVGEAETEAEARTDAKPVLRELGDASRSLSARGVRLEMVARRTLALFRAGRVLADLFEPSHR